MDIPHRREIRSKTADVLLGCRDVLPPPPANRGVRAAAETELADADKLAKAAGLALTEAREERAGCEARGSNSLASSPSSDVTETKTKTPLMRASLASTSISRVTSSFLVMITIGF